MSAPWMQVNRADQRAASIADRHYPRQSHGSRQFTPPARTLVLLTHTVDALWVTSWPFPEYVKHAWPGAWVCSLFRNESKTLSSAMIVQAVAVTRAYWRTPTEGMITFVDRDEVKSANPGWCFICAGFKPVGETKGGKRALHLAPADMPHPALASNWLLGLDVASDLAAEVA